MALHTFGTNANNSLNAITFNPDQGVGQAAAASLLAPADLAAIAQSIASDGHIAATNPNGILATGSTHTNTTLDTLVSTGGAPLAAIQIGSLVLGVGITPGTFVVAKPSGTSVTLSQAATTTAAGVRLIFIPPSLLRGEKLTFNGTLEIPGGRGFVIVKPGDVVAIDNTGWPILVSAAAVAYAVSLWTYT